MTPVPTVDFLAWAATNGVGLHPDYPDSDSITLLPPTECDRFWVRPEHPGAWPHFLASLLESLDEWQWGYLWPPGGTWPDGTDGFADELRRVVLTGAGVPAGWGGAVRVSADEFAAVAAVLFAALAFGWSVPDDIYFIPDHSRQLLHVDHHDVVHVECRSGDRILQVVADMSAAGFDLPTEPPDWTFKWPAWMGTKP